MKIEIEVSDKNEGTSAPYWLIIDPKQMMRVGHDYVASMITGPFFSREEAQAELTGRSYDYSTRAVVYCCSGYRSGKYKQAIEKAKVEAKHV